MLKIKFKEADGWVRNPEYYFDSHYTEAYCCDYMHDEFVKSMILDVDSSEVISDYVILSPVLGGIPPVWLSGGVKTLICMYLRPDKIFNITYCGDNCAKWILEMAKDRDITVVLRHIMRFPEYNNIFCLDTNEYVTSLPQLAHLEHKLMSMDDNAEQDYKS